MSAISGLNEFDARRIAVGQFALANLTAVSSIGTGIIIPAGAIVTNVRYMAISAVTNTNASAAVSLMCGLASAQITLHTTTMAALGALTVCGSFAPAVAGGVYVGSAGELQICLATSATSTAAGTYKVYVDYIYV
jgi:hypothetical protein